MNGQAIYDHYQQEPTSSAAAYARLLRTAFFVVGPERLFTMLELAADRGQFIELVYPIPPEAGPSEPCDIRLNDHLEL